MTTGTSSETLSERFAALAERWKTYRPRGVDVAQMIRHPAHQAIVEMGEQAVPLILKELERETDHWFPALHRLTGANPVPRRHEGNIANMKKAWLKWGRQRGLI